MKPLLSIVIANYNYGRFLEDAIRSVVSQNGFEECELIVVDGGSTDDSVEIIKKYAGKIAWWVSEPDRGQSDAFNKGFAHAKGKYLTWLNADDFYFPMALAVVLTTMKLYPREKWFTGSMAYVSAEGLVQRCYVAHRFSILRARTGILSVNAPSSFFARELYHSVGGFDVSMHYAMDTDMWNRFALAGVRYRRMRTLVVAFRVHKDSKTIGCFVADDESTRKRIQEEQGECDLLRSRYGGRWPIVRRLAILVSFSPVDWVCGIFRTWRYRGRNVLCRRDEN